MSSKKCYYEGFRINFNALRPKKSKLFTKISKKLFGRKNAACRLVKSLSWNLLNFEILMRVSKSSFFEFLSFDRN